MVVVIITILLTCLFLVWILREQTQKSRSKSISFIFKVTPGNTSKKVGKSYQKGQCSSHNCCVTGYSLVIWNHHHFILHVILCIRSLRRAWLGDMLRACRLWRPCCPGCFRGLTPTTALTLRVWPGHLLWAFQQSSLRGLRLLTWCLVSRE